MNGSIFLSSQINRTLWYRQKRIREVLSSLLPLKEKLRKTDWLIDQIAYKLYGLTEDETRIVEGNSSARNIHDLQSQGDMKMEYKQDMLNLNYYASSVLYPGPLSGLS